MLNPEQQKIFASLTKNTRVRVRFAEVTDPVWIKEPTDENSVPVFGDATHEGLYSSTMAVVVRGTLDEWRVDWVENAYVVLDSTEREGDDGEQEMIRVTPAHLREIEVLEPGDQWNRRETSIPGLEYTFVQRADGILEVGCQKIPRAGQEEIVRLLAERLDLEVRPVGFGDEGAKVSSALAALVSRLHRLPVGLDEFLGEDLYVQVMKALGRDDVLAERADVTASYGPGRAGGASYTGGQDGGQY